MTNDKQFTNLKILNFQLQNWKLLLHFHILFMMKMAISTEWPWMLKKIRRCAHFNMYCICQTYSIFSTLWVKLQVKLISECCHNPQHYFSNISLLF